MNYLSRKKVYQKLEPSKDAKKVYLFCEGEVTEVNYFKFFQDLSSNINIIPIPNDNGKSDPTKLKENAELMFFSDIRKYSLDKKYKDQVWFVIDTDRWNEKNKIQQLKDFCNEKNSHTKQWFIVQSNPCFELWFYYHSYSNKPLDEEVRKFKKFKTFLDTKIKGGFNIQKMAYQLDAAIQNSLQNFEIENDQPKLYSTEVHNLAVVIHSFVKNELENKAKRKAEEMIQNLKK